MRRTEGKVRDDRDWLVQSRSGSRFDVPTCSSVLCDVHAIDAVPCVSKQTRSLLYVRCVL